jgi:hypothetical protein
VYSVKLEEWMKQNMLVCEDVATAIGCDHTTIVRLIHKPGKRQTRNPSFELIRKIADFTGGKVTANDFVDDTPPSPTPSPLPLTETA